MGFHFGGMAFSPKRSRSAQRHIAGAAESGSGIARGKKRPASSPVSLASVGRCGFPTAKKNWRVTKYTAGAYWKENIADIFSQVVRVFGFIQRLSSSFWLIAGPKYVV
jgi:hypothetical protein